MHMCTYTHRCMHMLCTRRHTSLPLDVNVFIINLLTLFLVVSGLGGLNAHFSPWSAWGPPTLANHYGPLRKCAE